MLAALDDGRFDDAVEAWARKSVRLSEPEIAGFKASPAWSRAVDTIWTMRREGEARERLYPADSRYAEVSIPVRLLLGTQSGPHDAASTRLLERQLPDCRIVTLEGQSHTAHMTSPELVAAAVVDLHHQLQESR